MIAHLYGPIQGRRHDAFMLQESGILRQLEESPKYQAFCLYGDPAYPHRPQLQVGFRGAALNADQTAYNKAMSKRRQCVEWGFAKIITYWAFLDYRKNLKLLLQPVAKLYAIGALFTNVHTCMNGSQTSQYFSCHPPVLADYLREGQ